MYDTWPGKMILQQFIKNNLGCVDELLDTNQPKQLIFQS